MGDTALSFPFYTAHPPSFSIPAMAHRGANREKIACRARSKTSFQKSRFLPVQHFPETHAASPSAQRLNSAKQFDEAELSYDFLLTKMLSSLSLLRSHIGRFPESNCTNKEDNVADWTASGPLLCNKGLDATGHPRIS